MSDSAFKVLGLKRSASIDDIKRAYRVLAKTCHPDVNPTGQARFIEITEAYESALRAPPASDDTFQEAPMPPRGGSVPPAPPPTPRPPAPRHDPFADFQRSHARGAPGPWREVVEMSLEEVFVGTMVSVRHGTGSVLVTVPVGAPNGHVIVQRGVIPASIGQMRRDLHVTVRYARHAVFTPQGVDLLMTLKVGVDLAHKGGEQTIPGPEGKPVWVKIAPRSRSGTVLRMPQRGLPIPGGRRGDLLITLLVTLT